MCSLEPDSSSIKLVRVTAMSNCSHSFSLYELPGASFETELYWSNLCVLNGVKFAFFLTWILAYFSLFCYSAYLFYHHRQKRFNVYIYSLCCTFCILLIVLFSLFMTGVQTYAKFVLLAVSDIMIYVTSLLLTKKWYEFIMSMYKSGFGHMSEQEKRHFKLVYNTFFTAIVIGVSLQTLGFSGIGSMVTFHNQKLLNLCYTLSNIVFLLNAMMIATFYIYNGRRVLKIFRDNSPEVEPGSTRPSNTTSDKMNDFTTKVHWLVVSSTVTGVIYVLVAIALILWYSVITDHTINGVFFYTFTFVQIINIFGFYSFIRTVTYDKDYESHTSNHNSSSGVSRTLRTDSRGHNDNNRRDGNPTRTHDDDDNDRHTQVVVTI